MNDDAIDQRQAAAEALARAARSMIAAHAALERSRSDLERTLDAYEKAGTSLPQVPGERPDLRSAEQDRIGGVLLGLAAGDALGAGYEFAPAPDAARVHMIGGGLGPWEPGEWTDDTQLALCIAEAAEPRNVDSLQVAHRFLEWFAARPKDVGAQTRAVLSRAKHPSELRRLAVDHYANHPNASAGNGSLMRTAPIALAHLGDDEAIVSSAAEVSSLTHADPLAQEACILWSIAIDRAVRERRLDGIYDALALIPSRSTDFWARALADAERSGPSQLVPNGYVVVALQAAWSAIRRTPVPGTRPCEHLTAALRSAVSIGDDTDTVAAIAGSLLGGFWGATAVPLRWRQVLHGWPGHRADELVRLGLHIANAWSTPTPPTARSAVTKAGGLAPNVFGLSLVDRPYARVHVDVGLTLSTTTGAASAPDWLPVWLPADGSETSNLEFVLLDTVDFIAAQLQQRRSVCLFDEEAMAGRGAAVAAAHAMRAMDLGPKTALEQVRSVIPNLDVDPGYLAALDRLPLRMPRSRKDADRA